MSEYKGINISPEVIVVEKVAGKEQETPQGYVVPSNRLNMLESAMNWARWSDYDWTKRKYTTHHEGIQHTYKNGTFKIRLYEAAGGSSQGGKLSFWNCTVIAEDGKEFIIGINQALLLDILLNSTVVNGEVQGNVWLGREKNNTGVYLESMEAFKQAIKDEETRNLKVTSAYKIGDMVSTKTSNEEEVYLGIGYEYFERTQGDYSDNYADVINIYRKPRERHVFRSFNRSDWGSKLFYFTFDKNKPKRVIRGQIIGVDRPEQESFYAEHWNNTEATDSYRFYYYLRHLQYSLYSDKYSPEELKKLISDMHEECIKMKNPDYPCYYDVCKKHLVINIVD